MQHLDGIARIAGQYDGFVLDVWGVLHALVSLASVTMVVVGLSLITHRLIEMPARRLLRRVQLRSSPARSPEGARGAPLAEGIP